MSQDGGFGCCLTQNRRQNLSQQTSRPSGPAFQGPPPHSWLQETCLTTGANLGRWMVLQDSPLLGLLGGQTDVQSWSLGLNQVLGRKGKALTPLQAYGAVFLSRVPSTWPPAPKGRAPCQEFPRLCPTEQADT